jgi:hypothetical protein
MAGKATHLFSEKELQNGSWMPARNSKTFSYNDEKCGGIGIIRKHGNIYRG